MLLPLAEVPRTVCILRLSAIGDTCHVVPVLRTMQQAWPATRFTWIIAATESRLMRLIEDVEFIIVDKKAGAGGRAAVTRALAGRSFDVLLHMQLALRASLIAREVRAPIKLGFDRARARELQWLFTNARIAARSREHVLDAFFGFAAALGLTTRLLRWDLPLPPGALEYARALIPDEQP
ncbi:MAG TPA: glycosyltransferase family 9 protein, partial [Steroidobacteraceae bacterium]